MVLSLITEPTTPIDTMSTDVQMGAPGERQSFSSGGRGSRDRETGRAVMDDPPNSRLFVICARQTHEDEFVSAFSEFGDIEDIWIVKDRQTNEPKGIVYIKFAKASQAALAMEEMNGKCVGNAPKPIKVLIANNRQEGNRKDHFEEERLLRLFVIIPKAFQETDLRNVFEPYGDIEYVNIVKDRKSGESKGLAYIKYHKASHAAKALEECDKSFKAVLAEPKGAKYQNNDGGMMGNGVDMYGSGHHNGGHYGTGGSTALLGNTPADRASILQCLVSPTISQEQLTRLFDLVPGLDYCDLKRDLQTGRSKGFAFVKYVSAQQAMYAREKLHGFEYPPGHRLVVRWANESGTGGYQDQSSMMAGRASGGAGGAGGGAAGGAQGNGQAEQALNMISSLTQALTQFQSAQQSGQQNSADQLQQALGSMMSILGTSGAVGQDSLRSADCSVQLPAPQPLASQHSEMAKRLFIVCAPRPLPTDIMRDLFSRFGNLMDVYMLPAKTFGYAKYASAESGQLAIDTLHGAEVLGVKLKVMEAEPQPEDSGRDRKRPRT